MEFDPENPNKVTIDIKEILNSPPNSITDGETIRQIALAGLDRKLNLSKEVREELSSKVRREFAFAGLYPHVMKTFDILPDHLKNESDNS